MRTVSFLLLLAGAGLVAPAGAQPVQPAPEASPIVVQGVHDRDKQIRNFIRDLTPAPVHGQLSRFDSPICPAVAGLSTAQASAIAERMRRVAAAVGIRVDKPSCAPNVILIVTDDKAALLKKLEVKRPEYFPPDWSSIDVHELEHDPSPVAAWQFEGTFWADGRPLSDNVVASAISIDELQKTIEPSTRLRPAARHDFLTSVVLVQRQALNGLTTTQLADYVAMRALVRTDPKRLRTSSADTILSVIEAPMGSAVPLTLTAWDLSFLRAFYSSGKNNYAEYQRSEMQRLMKRELDQAQAQAQ